MPGASTTNRSFFLASLFTGEFSTNGTEPFRMASLKQFATSLARSLFGYTRPDFLTTVRNPCFSNHLRNAYASNSVNAWRRNSRLCGVYFSINSFCGKLVVKLHLLLPHMSNFRPMRLFFSSNIQRNFFSTAVAAAIIPAAPAPMIMRSVFTGIDESL